MLIGVTGHRDVEQEPGELLTFARLFVGGLRQKTPVSLTIITGMARGWDLKVARACIDCGVPFIAAIPFPGHQSLWKSEDRKDYDFAIRRASQVEVISKLALNHAYVKRDRWIVDQCDELWALDSGRPSGSHLTVLYAEQQHRIVRPLWEPWLRFRAERN